MPAAVAIPAAISAGSSIFGGIMGARAAKSAAQIQQEEAQRQAQGFRDLVNEYNPRIQSTAEQARQDVLTAANTAGTNLTGVARDAAGNLVNVAERGAGDITGSAERANEYLQPYLGVGTQAAKTLAEYMAPGGELNRDFTFKDMQRLDPGYQFRLDQAQRALMAGGAARGGNLGGGAIRAANQLAQNVATSEYGAAFDRFRNQQTDRFDRFSNLMDMGVRTGTLAGANLMTAADRAAGLRADAARTGGGWNVDAARTAGGWNTGAAEYGGNAMTRAMEVQANNAIGAQRSIADLMTGGAAAQAAGKVGAANAWGGMLGGLAGAANQVGGYYQQKKLLSQMGYGAAQGPSPEQLWNMPGPQNPWTTNPNFWYGSPANPTAPGGPPTAMPMSGGYSAAPWSSMTPNYYGGVPSSPGYLGKYGGYRW